MGTPAPYPTSVTAREIATIEREVQQAYTKVTPDILAATAIPQGRDLDPEEFLATCKLSFRTILMA